MNIDQSLCALITYAKSHELIAARDEDNIFKKVCQFFDVEPFRCFFDAYQSYEALMHPLVDHFIKTHGLNHTIDEKDKVEAMIMNLVMPNPTEVKRQFYQNYRESSQIATSDLFKLMQDVNYIKSMRLKRNISWTSDTSYGTIEVTINLQKPEKDPKEIAQNKKTTVSVDNNKPACIICKENEMNPYYGKSNLRLIPMSLANELWHFQFSPYQYFDEHAIILHDEHRPMKITEKTVSYLIDFVNQFPHYFIGSNADLPIVGGSILNHDHFQAGRHIFPIEYAKINTQVIKDEVTISHLNWPLTTLKMESKHAKQLVYFANQLIALWRDYEDLSHQIIPYTKDTPHQTITPILRKKDETYHLYMILRNNRTNDDYPDGIFHVHPERHHIKKENIGLIEAMGRVILP